MIIDKNIQLFPMLAHTQADGSNIGGVAPVSYGMNRVPGKRQRLLLWTKGNTGKPTDYPAWMAYPAAPRPILPNTGNLRMSMEYALGGNLAGCNVVETDTLIVKDGLMFNRSFQHNQAKGFQIADVDGNWADTGINPGPLVANRKYAVAFDNVFNLKDSSTIAIEQDGVNYPAAAWPSIPAKPTTWKPDGVYVQIQLGSMPNGLMWSLNIGMDLIWL